MSKTKIKELEINGELYVLKGSENKKAVTSFEGLEYCIVRTYSAGVFAGYLKDEKGKEGTVLNARRLWYWSGAASLSQLAVDGVNDSDNCKFPVEVTELRLKNIIEIIPTTEKARLSIAGVKIWKQ